jgi:prevent-host-death family protein
MTTKTIETVTIADATQRLAELVRLAQQGTEVLITDAGEPLARLLPATASDQPRVPGLNEGEAWISDDFDAELPEEFWLGKE